MDFDASQADLTTALLFGRPRRAGARVVPPAGVEAVEPRAGSVDAGAIFILEKGAFKIYRKSVFECLWTTRAGRMFSFSSSPFCLHFTPSVFATSLRSV